MNGELFDEIPAHPQAPLEAWMVLGLNGHPADLEALARIPAGILRRECFLCLMDFRERGEEVIAAMREQALKARKLGRTTIGGIRLAGAIWNIGEGIEMANETGCFYALPLSIIHPDLADVLACEGKHAIALKKAEWKP